MRNRLVVVLSALLLVASTVNLAVLLAPLHPGILAIQFSFTPEAYWRVLDAWGASGRALYRAHFRFDSLHPFVYGTFGYLLASRTALFSGTRPAVHRAALLALPLAGLFDLAENATQLVLLGLPPGSRSVLIPLSATCSLLKWLLAVLFAAAAAIRVVRLARGKTP